MNCKKKTEFDFLSCVNGDQWKTHLPFLKLWCCTKGNKTITYLSVLDQFPFIHNSYRFINLGTVRISVYLLSMNDKSHKLFYCSVLWYADQVQVMVFNFVWQMKYFSWMIMQLYSTENCITNCTQNATDSIYLRLFNQISSSPVKWKVKQEFNRILHNQIIKKQCTLASYSARTVQL